MSKSTKYEITPLYLEGKFLDFVIKDGYKLKGLLLETVEGEIYVKLAKQIRHAFDWRLPKGTLLQIVGEKKYDPATGEVKLKAERVMAASLLKQSEQGSKPDTEEIPNSQFPNPKSKIQNPKSTILMCQKSDCMRSGGKEVCQALEAALSKCGLDDAVTIKGTGCMKNCKGGPNLVMPDKTRYSRVNVKQIPAIVEKHLAHLQEQENKEEIACGFFSFQ